MKSSYLPKLELNRMLTISTIHVKPETRKKLEDWDNQMGYHHIQEISVYQKEEYGWIIYLLNSYRPNTATVIPLDLKACLDLAYNLGCDILCLDRDGRSVVPLLPEYPDEI